MRIFKYISLIALLVVSLAATTKTTQSPTVEELKTSFHTAYDRLVTNLEQWSEDIAMQDDASLQSSYLDIRKQFKSIEPLLTYYAEADYNLYFNGAPLPKLEKNVPDVTVLQPVGMQVIDEEVYGDTDRQKLQPLVDGLANSLTKTGKMLKVYPLDRRMLLEAVRSEIVRIVALSLSGFDTPGSANVQQDVLTTTAAIKNILSHFAPMMNAKEKQVFDLIDQMQEKVGDAQEATDLDFVRIIKAYLDPIYGLVLDFHLRSGIEHIREVSDRPTALNYYAKSVFAEDFLNVSPFSRINTVDTSAQKIALGKKLFFDKIMSHDTNQSCATCHNPKMGFADHKKVSTIDVDGRMISRNSPTLLNSIYNRAYFHDMRTKNPDLQVDHVVYNKNEFNTDYVEIAQKLKDDAEYSQLFATAYEKRNGLIDRHSITDAIVQYVASLKSFDSDFDRYMRGESDTIAQDVYAGFNLFMGKGACASCHFVPVFNGTVPPAFEDTESEILGTLKNNDFDNPILDDDPGRVANGDVRQASEIYHRSFKTATVRNVALTHPYMHNGVHNTLEEVVKFYNFGGGAGMGLDVPYQTLPPDSLGLTDVEIGQLVSFMEALTDVPN